MRNSLVLFAALLALPAAAQQAPDRAALARELDPILERLGTPDPGHGTDAMRMLEWWLSHAKADARSIFEPERPNASGRWQAGREKALKRLEEAELAWKCEAEATDGDPKRAFDLLRGAAGGREEDAEAIARWAGVDAKALRDLVVGYRGHLESSIAAYASELTPKLEKIEEWKPVLDAFAQLGIPSVRGAERVQVKSPIQSHTKIPVASFDSCLHAWRLEKQKGDCQLILLDDGTIRVETRGSQPSDFSHELMSYSYNTTKPTYPGGSSGFWRAGLFARWAFERGRLTEALYCLDAARGIAEDTWLRSGPTQWADDVLRTGADFLLAQAASRVVAYPAADTLWNRLEALPFDACKAVARPELNRIKRELATYERHQKLGEKGDDMSPAEQAEYYSLSLLWSASDLRNVGKGSDFLESLERDGPIPMQCLLALRWTAVPALLSALGDDTPTAQWIGDRRLTLDDAARFLLNQILGPTVPLHWDPMTNTWLDMEETSEATRARVEAFWKRLEPLDDRGRTIEVWKTMGSPANAWALKRIPDLALEPAWRALPPELESRRRAVEILRLVRNLSEAPREKLEALLKDSEGDLRCVVQQALDRK